VLALALGEGGGNAFRATEVWVGEPSEGLRVGGRWLGVNSEAPGSALVRATLVADDDAPTGLHLEDELDPGDLPADDPYGTEALPCTVPVSGPFDPSWLVDGTCLRSQVDGATVVLEVE